MPFSLPKRAPLIISAILASLCACPAIAGQIVATWDGGTASWTAANWTYGSTTSSIFPNNNATDTFLVRIDGGKTVTNSQVALSTNVAIDGLMVELGDRLNIGNGSSLTIEQSLDINGTVGLQGAGSNTQLIVDGDATLSGTAIFANSNSTANRLVVNEGKSLTVEGDIGLTSGTMTLTGPGTLANQGTIASTNSTLAVSGTTVENAGGVVEARDGGVVRMDNGGVIRGGTLRTEGTGSFGGSAGGALDGVHLDGASIQVSTNQSLGLRGEITGAGVGGLRDNGGGLTELVVDADATLAGSLALANSEVAANRNRLRVADGKTLTVTGELGATAGGMSITGPGGVANQGTISVSGGSNMTFDAGAVNNLQGSTLSGGTWVVNGGSSLVMSGALITTNDATIVLNGASSQFNAINGLTTNEGTFSLANGRNFTVAAATDFTNIGLLEVASSTFTASTLINHGTIVGDGVIAATTFSDGVISPGFSSGLLSFEGDLTLLGGSLLSFELFGLDRAGSYDAIDVFGLAHLDGLLDVFVDPTFGIRVGDRFEVLRANQGLLGSFDLDTVSASNSPFVTFNIDVEGNSVWLTTASVVPEPSSVVLSGLGLLLILGVGTRRKWAARTAR